VRDRLEGWAEIGLRSALWLLLGGWVGAWLLFGAVVAPTLFRLLPSPALAGSIVNPVLATLHLSAGAAGLVLALLTLALGRPTWLAVPPLLLGALCLASHFGVSAEISRLSEVSFGSEGSLELATRFALLHRVSVGTFVLVGVGVLALVPLHAWADARAVR
jgi:hypothetical protein